MVKVLLAPPGLQTQSSSHSAIQLKSYCWEGVEFIQLVYCTIIYLSFSAVVDFSSEKYSGSTGHRNSWYQSKNLQWACQWWNSNLQPLDSKPIPLANELYSWTAIAGRELSLSSMYCISIYLSFCQLWLAFHPRRPVVLLDTVISGTSREIYSEQVDGETLTCNPLITNQVL